MAAVHTLAGLRIASQLRQSDVDLVEIRLDAFASGLPAVKRAVAAMALPILFTVRHPAEGGVGALSTARRRELFEAFLPSAALVDVELRSLAALPDVLASARALGVGVVVSNHHFRSTPSVSRMLTLQRQAFQGGADLFKIAALAPTVPAFARLLEFAVRPAPGPHAIMGMGAYGQVSRLALAQAGSALNYGYLDQPNAPGQWEARELKKLLARLSLQTP